jgi:hypothetical protein
MTAPSQSDRPRRALADPLVADAHRDRQICLLLLRADNNGEGGTLSLMALATARAWPTQRAGMLLSRHDLGAAMFLGDCDDHAGDLGSVGRRRPEDSGARSRSLCRRPVTVVILILLFCGAESRDGALVAAAFGPVMVLWFLVLGVLGLYSHQRRSGRAGCDQSPITAHSFCSHGVVGLSRWARSSWRSPAARRSTPTSAISAASRSRRPGCFSSARAGPELSRPGRAGAGRSRGHGRTRSIA